MLSRDCTVTSVAKAARAHLRAINPTEPAALIDGVAELVETLFRGEHPDFQKADLKYHNLDHTVLATQCFIELAEARARRADAPVFNGRQFSLGFVAILLHDSGYLKSRDDVSGTGAKYTSSHVTRSCAMAARVLPAMGCTSDEILGIQNAIRCTGVNSDIRQIAFANDVQHMIGCMVATADYLGQMADPDYPAKLPALFEEFEEANNFSRVPFDKRPFRSAKELMVKTEGFWRGFALPRLENDYAGVYRVLADATGRNAYIEAVERNVARIAALATG